jgi:hypothetical protein
MRQKTTVADSMLRLYHPTTSSRYKITFIALKIDLPLFKFSGYHAAEQRKYTDLRQAST